MLFRTFRPTLISTWCSSFLNILFKPLISIFFQLNSYLNQSQMSKKNEAKILKKVWFMLLTFTITHPNIPAKVNIQLCSGLFSFFYVDVVPVQILICFCILCSSLSLYFLARFCFFFVLKRIQKSIESRLSYCFSACYTDICSIC